MTTGPLRPKAGMSQQAKAKGAVTRAQRSVDRIDQEYGAANIPLDHPLYAKRAAAKARHREALRAFISLQEGS